MKKLRIVMMAMLAAGMIASCSKNADPSSSSSVNLVMSASSTPGKATINGRVAATPVTLSVLKVNVRDIKFDYDHGDKHFEHDSSYVDNDQKLVGPFIVDLLNAGSFADQVIANVTLPNASYEKVSFKLVPGKEAGDMLGKSILISGKIDTTNFVFWHNRDARFGAKLADSTAIVANGGAVTLAIQLEIDKALSVINGGVDLTNAHDGNQDGTITIDPLNTDGNKELADQIMMLLIRHAHCKKDNH